MNLLIANRGEIARRIMRSTRDHGWRTIAVYSEADRDALHVREADAAVCIGGAAPRESYLNIPAIIDAATRTEANAVHPGYGFLAENADFAQAVLDAELMWIGPSPDRDPPDGRQGRGEAHRGSRRRADRAGRRGNAGGRARDRFSVDDQGGRGRRRARHAAGRERSRVRRGARLGALGGRACIP